MSLLKDEAGLTCAFTRAVGKGEVTLLGFNLRYMSTAGSGQHNLVTRLVEATAGARAVWASPRPCAAFQLQGPDAGVVCLVSPVELSFAPQVHYSSPDGERRRLPVVLEGVDLMGRGARLLPVSQVLGGATVLAHSTWELLGLQPSGSVVTLSFSCPTATGEVALGDPVNEPRLTGGRLSKRCVQAEDGLNVLVVEAQSELLKLTVEVDSP